MYLFTFGVFFIYGCFTVFGDDPPSGYYKHLADNMERGIENLTKLSSPYKKIEETTNFERELYKLVQDEEKYDFIIVGAGTAGATLANRLSEMLDWKILLLEAGDAEDEITQIPSLSFHLLFSKYNWGYFTSPQKNWCYGSDDRKCLLAMGKALGGSTAINGMLWARGNYRDYNTWAQQGNEGWSYEQILPYFKKLENSQTKHFSSDHQGLGGKVNLENPRLISHATEYILRAAHELKIPYVNYNAGKQLGIGHAQGTLKNGKRWSSARAYLGDTEKRPNLVIRSKSTVLKVLIDEADKKAFGVQYLQNDRLFEVHATKEVILSAGGFGSPKLLALSGVGPRKDLEQLGIKPLANLRVGSPLRTHLSFPGLKFIFSNSTLATVNKKHDIIDYLRNGRGPLTAFSADLVAYMKTEVSRDSDDQPDIELTFAPKRHVTKTSTDKLAVSVSVILMHPRSVGTVKILSEDPLQSPIIDPNYFTDEGEEDMKTVLAGIRLAQKFIDTSIFKRYGGYLDPEPVQACEHLEFNSDSYWKCAVQQLSICLSDPASTAKMGPKDDVEAVVDNRLRVHGIKNLRVVDNSVIPVAITGHMMAPAYMIGEKAADIIKFFWKNK